MKIAIIGFGHVGKHVEQLIKDHYEYCVYDPKVEEQINTDSLKELSRLSENENLTTLNNREIEIVNPLSNINSTINSTRPFGIIYSNDPTPGLIELPFATKEYINKNCNLAIICVPTPMAKDGSCDTSIVEEVVAWLETPLILIKSTVEPGTVYRLNEQYRELNTGDRLKHIVFSPEFIGESTYYNPIMKTMKDEPFIIFGGDPIDTQAMVDIFKPILGPLVKYIQCSAIEAELTKYLENVFFAAKVSICNEFYDACKAFGVEYDKVREIWLNDPRINRMHTSVFKERGWSGKCFPKDISAFVKACEKKGFEPKIMKQVIKSNDELIKKYG